MLSNSICATAARVNLAAVLGITTLCLTGISPTIAQEASQEDFSDVIFEEVVVTAQKREQNIMEVPVAVSAVTGQQIEDAGIKDVFDLQQNVPNLIIGRSQTATTTNFAIRGIGSTSNNFGVESSVGLYVDGVYRSRQSSMINELIDVESVEVLRGPQGTLFGKNTPAGAVQVRTVAPSQERNSFVDVTVGDLGLVRVSAAANIPINDDWAFRGTLFSSQRDGYIDDINLGKDIYNDRDRQGLRLQLAYEPNDDFKMRVIADYAQIDEVCCATTALVDGLFSQQSLTGVPEPGSDAALLQFGATIFTTFDYPQALLDGAFGPLAANIITDYEIGDHVTAYNFAPTSENEDGGLSVEFNKTFDNGMTLTSITALRTFDTFDDIDLDFTTAPLGQRINDARLDSFSQELRLAGEFGSGGNYVVGLYYFGQEIDQVTQTNGFSPALETYLTLNEDVQDIVAGIGAVAGLAGAPYQPAGIPFLPGLVSRDVITQDQDGWAAFGQVDFPLGDDFILTLGARYTDESKKIDAVYTQNTPNFATPPDFAGIAFELCVLTNCDPGNPGIPAFNPARLADPNVFAIYSSFFADGWGAYAVAPLSPRDNLPRPGFDDEFSDDQSTGTVKLTWFPSDTSMLYTSFSTGFKSGGTNTERIPSAFDPIFGAETSESFEIGFKGDVGPVRLALTYYDATFDDFQAQTFTGTGFNLQNAGEIDNSGYEAEFLWRPTHTTEVQLIYTHAENDYASFESGTCWDTFPFHTGIDDPGLPPGLSAIAPEVCDKSGNPVAYNPEDRLFIAAQQDFSLTDDTLMFLRVEYSSSSEQFTDGDLDPFTVQDDFDVVNARIGFLFDSWNASLTFWGRNIGDERYSNGSFDAPIQVGRMNLYPAEPATYGATFHKNFD